MRVADRSLHATLRSAPCSRSATASAKRASAAGVDFAQAELATKIRGKYLRALEDEQFELLPAETYVKGFLRTYADYLGLDGQLYVDEFNSRFVAGEEHDARAHARAAARRAAAPEPPARDDVVLSRSPRSPS